MARSRRHVRPHVALAALVLAGLAPDAGRADIVLSDNLSAPTGGTETATGSTWLAAGFGSGSSGSSLTSVALLLSRAAAGGTAEVDLYTDGGLEPGTLVGVLAPSGGL